MTLVMSLTHLSHAHTHRLQTDPRATRGDHSAEGADAGNRRVSNVPQETQQYLEEVGGWVAVWLIFRAAGRKFTARIS